MRSGSDVRLVTPEAVVVELAAAGIGSRLVALLIDVSIQGAALFVLLLVFSAVGGVVDSATGDAGAVAAIVFYFSIFAARLFYPSILEAAWRGRTPGKAAMGLRVVTSEGAPVRFRHTIVRAALGLVDFELTAGSGAFFTALLSRRNQRLGDLAAGTIVVRERTGAPEPTAIRFPVPPRCESYVATLDVSGLGVEDHTAVRSFLLRAPTLDPQSRSRLSVQLAEPIAARLRHRPPSWVGPELFLACVAAAWQLRSAAGPPAWAPAGASAPEPSPAADDDGGFAAPT